MTRLIITASLLAGFLLSGCTLPDVYAKANQEANVLWTGYLDLRQEHWNERRELRRICRDEAIRPGIKQLLQEGRILDATMVIRANYPDLLLVDLFNDAREDIGSLLSDMPACEWPEDVKLDPPRAPAATDPLGPFMLVPAS